MSEFESLYQKLYGNPPIAEFKINTNKLFEVLNTEGKEVSYPYPSIQGVLVYDGKLQLLTFVNCKNFKSKTVPVFEPITRNIVAFVSKMFSQVFRLPKNKEIKVVIRKDVIEFKLPGENFSLIDVDGYVLLK
jgi:hypothetical protein